MFATYPGKKTIPFYLKHIIYCGRLASNLFIYITTLLSCSPTITITAIISMQAWPTMKSGSHMLREHLYNACSEISPF